MTNKITIFSWNVNGLRAVLRKESLQEFLNKCSPDVLCLQEIKCRPAQLDLLEEGALNNYDIFWNPAEKAGYSGTATLVKKSLNIKPKTIDLSQNLLNKNQDEKTQSFEKLAKTEGRILTLDFGNFFLINVYTPNSKPDLSRLSLRETTWDPEYKNLLKKLEKEKPVITCGDFNVANEEIDLARPKTNHKNAGFTNEERQGIKNLINSGFLDTFRFLHPEEIRYTWWSHWGKARENNVGWRIDYFFISKSLEKNLLSAEIYEASLGSDHCPISITLEI